MKKQATGRDVQRVNFAESLYKTLNKKTQEAKESHQRWMRMASTYLEDGMEVEECIELLEIDGLSKEAAKGYVNMAVYNEKGDSDGEHEYSFQFEDSFGRIWSSSDFGRIIKASSDNDAWQKAEEVVFSDIYECEPEKIISVSRIE